MAFLQQQFGKAGRYYHAIARAEDLRPVVADRQRKSVGSETTFAQDLTEFTDLLDGLRPAIEDVWEYCQRTGILARTVTLKVKFSDFQQITRSRSSTGPVGSAPVLERICRELVESLFPLPKGVRLLGVTLSNLSTAGLAAGRQLMLSL